MAAADTIALSIYESLVDYRDMLAAQVMSMTAFLDSVTTVPPHEPSPPE